MESFDIEFSEPCCKHIECVTGKDIHHDIFSSKEPWTTKIGDPRLWKDHLKGIAKELGVPYTVGGAVTATPAPAPATPAPDDSKRRKTSIVWTKGQEPDTHNEKDEELYTPKQKTLPQRPWRPVSASPQPLSPPAAPGALVPSGPVTTAAAAEAANDDTKMELEHALTDMVDQKQNFLLRRYNSVVHLVAVFQRNSLIR